MTSDTADRTAPAADAIQAELLRFLETKTRTVVDVEQDLFGSGLVSSLFAMELVVHLENVWDVSVAGPDLKQDNFRSVRRMTDLVLRLRGA